MNQSKDIQTPSGKIVSDNQVDRLFGLKRTLNDELATVNEDLVPDLAADDEPPTKKLRTENDSTKTAAPAEEPPLFYKALPEAISTEVQVPSKKMTGVDPSLTEVCATISQQIYDATSADDFNLSDGSHHVELLEFTNHGLLKDSVPPFVIAVSGDAIILGWRGSSNVMDWTSDFAYAPVSSARWNKITPHIRAHSTYTALVESDLSTYEDKIIAAINQRKNISQLILTGHSLAGGMAQVAHLFIEGQMQQRGTAWSSVSCRVTCRTVAFSGPMTTLNMDIHHTDEATNEFMMKISENSCNIVFSCDAVPHAVGDIEYLNNVVEALIPDLVKQVPGGYIVRRVLGVGDKIENAYDSVIKGYLKDLFPVLVSYHHVGNIIYYHDKEATPVVLRDSVYHKDINVPEFRGYAIAMPKSTRNDSTIQQLTDAHLFFPTALAYNVKEDEE